jgi:hypothetical protein
MKRTKVRHHITHSGTGVDAAALQHDAHALSQCTVVRDRVKPQNSYRARFGSSKALTDLNGAGFAGPIWPEDDSHTARWSLERDIVDSHEVAIGNTQIFDNNGHVSTLRTIASQHERRDR